MQDAALALKVAAWFAGSAAALYASLFGLVLIDAPAVPRLWAAGLFVCCAFVAVGALILAAFLAVARLVGG